jgi:hypothetical protein
MRWNTLDLLRWETIRPEIDLFVLLFGYFLVRSAATNSPSDRPGGKNEPQSAQKSLISWLGRYHRNKSINVSVKLKLATLWASFMFLYIYVDYFALYMLSKIDDILKGK